MNADSRTTAMPLTGTMARSDPGLLSSRNALSTPGSTPEQSTTMSIETLTNQTEAGHSTVGTWGRRAAWVPSRVKQRLWRQVAEPFERIRVDDSVMGGEPTIAGTRIPVELIVSLVAEGKSVSELPSYFDNAIDVEDVHQALRFTAALTR
jgi:uncharacterized protein (DUF433 family)